jgi:hypothetical protein
MSRLRIHSSCNNVRFNGFDNIVVAALCRRFGLLPSDLLDKWSAFCANNRIEMSDLNEANVSKFVKEVWRYVPLLSAQTEKQEKGKDKSESKKLVRDFVPDKKVYNKDTVDMLASFGASADVIASTSNVRCPSLCSLPRRPAPGSARRSRLLRKEFDARMCLTAQGAVDVSSPMSILASPVEQTPGGSLRDYGE